MELTLISVGLIAMLAFTAVFRAYPPSVTILQMTDLVEEKLRELLSGAQAAHHDFESTELGGQFDEKWAAWYAQCLDDNGLTSLLGRKINIDQLATKLDEISQRHKAERTAESWAEYTARELINNPI